MTATAIAGGFAALLLIAVLDPHEEITNVDLILVVAAGALISLGLYRAIRW